MDMRKLPIGSDVPDNVNVVIEIPTQSSPVKYEIDKESGVLLVDRIMSAPMFYPANYGFIPHTLADDGDPADVLVVSSEPLVHGCVVPSRPVGILRMKDEAGEDAKILAVPAGKICHQSQNIYSYKDLPPRLIAQITHFFEHYKELEEGKWVEIEGWQDADEAKAEIIASIRRFEESDLAD